MLLSIARLPYSISPYSGHWPCTSRRAGQLAATLLLSRRSSYHVHDVIQVLDTDHARRCHSHPGNWRRISFIPCIRVLLYFIRRLVHLYPLSCRRPLITSWWRSLRLVPKILTDNHLNTALVINISWWRILLIILQPITRMH